MVYQILISWSPFKLFYIFKIFGLLLNTNKWKGQPVVTFTIFSNAVYWEPLRWANTWSWHGIPGDLGSCLSFTTNPDICPQMDLTTISASCLLCKRRASKFQYNVLLLSLFWDSKRKNSLRKMFIHITLLLPLCSLCSSKLLSFVYCCHHHTLDQ